MSIIPTFKNFVPFWESINHLYALIVCFCFGTIVCIQKITMTEENLKMPNVIKKVISLFVVILFALISCQRDRVSGDVVVNQRVTSLNQNV